MSARHLVETASTLIRDNIKANISTALGNIRTDRADAFVTTEIPQSYYFYEAQGYRSPVVFIIADNINFRKEERGANFISATIRYNISVLIEDRTEPYLTTKAWRYQAALHEVLDQTQLADSGSKIKVITIVKRATFSPTFTKSGESPALFRKEVLLECDAEIYENF